MVLALIVVSLGSLVAARAATDSSDEFFDNHTIPRIRIQLDQDALAALRNKFREYTKATVMEGTNIWRDVGIHLKGQYGTFQGIDGRPSLTLNFDKYQKGQRFHGLDKLHLNNSGQDPSYLCEMIGRQLFEAAGIPTPRASHARVELNGRDLGLFVLVEGYDKKFLRRHFENPDGNLYDSEFRHDITDPIKKSSGKGPDDHSDLRALAAAAEEPDHAARMTRLSKLLDLDRFYTTLALETLIRHHDGYAMGINNYRVYQNPENGEPLAKRRSSRGNEALANPEIRVSNSEFQVSLLTSAATSCAVAPGRAVFLPHGMDQLFFDPRAGLLPDLRGTLAEAVLETQAGRREFRARCMTLFTNLFPGPHLTPTLSPPSGSGEGEAQSAASRSPSPLNGLRTVPQFSPSPLNGERAGVRGETARNLTLSNRVANARAKLRPMLAELDAKTARHADAATTNLLYRIQERQQQLQRAVFRTAEAPIFDQSGVARLTNWLATVEGGRVTFSETNSAGEPSLEVRISSSGKATLARFEKSVLLTAGTYRFSATVKADQPVFRGPKPSVALRIWGVNEMQMETARPDPQTMEFQCTFEVGLENVGEYLLQCEARGKGAAVTYNLASIILAHLP
jgi:hypothetical protein